MADPLRLANPLALVTSAMAREVAASQGVCGRPLIRRVIDRDTGSDTQVAIPCGSTRERVCPACAAKARRLRIQQCAEGWHRDTEPEDYTVNTADVGQVPDDLDAGVGGASTIDTPTSSRRIRSTRRRADAPDLPRVPTENRTVGRTYSSPQGREYRPSMFLTLTLPPYGAVRAGAPVDPETYDYRRAALDAVVFPRLVDRFWQNLRRVAGFRVQYFAAVEPQHRLAPHLHAAIRGTIPRQVIKQVVKATYLQVWWPSFDAPVYVHRKPCWDGHDYCDPDTGELLPTWQEALDQADPDTPVHVSRFGKQLDMAGIVAPSKDADRAIRYLTKYLTKSYAPKDDDETPPDPRYLAHIDRLHDELHYLPCGERCANWLRYGIQPMDAGPGLVAGRCAGKAHDRDHLGLGGRRVLVSRQWSGKTLAEHRADRATVVREALEAAGMLAPEIERMAATVLAKDGKPRFVWTDTRPDATTYIGLILAAISEQQRWRAQYQAAKDAAGAVDNCSADIGPP